MSLRPSFEILIQKVLPLHALKQNLNFKIFKFKKIVTLTTTVFPFFHIILKVYLNTEKKNKCFPYHRMFTCLVTIYIIYHISLTLTFS